MDLVLREGGPRDVKIGNGGGEVHHRARVAALSELAAHRAEELEILEHRDVLNGEEGAFEGGGAVLSHEGRELGRRGRHRLDTSREVTGRGGFGGVRGRLGVVARGAEEAEEAVFAPAAHALAARGRDARNGALERAEASLAMEEDARVASREEVLHGRGAAGSAAEIVHKSNRGSLEGAVVPPEVTSAMGRAPRPGRSGRYP